MNKLLIIDDEASILNSLGYAFEDEYEVYKAKDAREALELAAGCDMHIALLDLRLGIENGIDVLRRLKKVNPGMVVIMMTAFGSFESAVEATKEGAFYYITKPVEIESLKLLLKKAEEYEGLSRKVKYLSDQIAKVNSKYHLIGKSKKMAGVYDIIDRVKDIDSNVLITGESGTGKELVARAVHYEGRRKSKPFNVINCSAIPANLLESELFGYVKGAFTGAVQDRTGIIEMSDGGTLFLDEIGDMDLNLQAKLLRVLQDKVVTPLGSNRSVKTDVRFISATNRHLKELMTDNRFRNDLYYRLNVINIEIPSLRERKEDIPLLADHFVKVYSAKMNKNINGITKEALECLENYRFDGNVRELENLIERAVALTGNEYITKWDFPEEVFLEEHSRSGMGPSVDIKIGDPMRTVEKKVIEATLKECGGNRRTTAGMMGISERALRYKIKEYGINL